MTNLAAIRQKYPYYNNASDEELANALHKKYYSHVPIDKFYEKIGFEPEDKGISGIGKDLIKSLKQSPKAVWESLKELPEEAAGATKQLFTNPKRFGQNIAAGFTGFGQGVHNAPRNIADYLAKKEIISPETAKVFPRDELNIFEAFGGHGQQPGDVFLRGLASPANVLGEAGALSSLGRGAARGGAGALQAIGENENPVIGGINQALTSKLIESTVNNAGGIKRGLSNRSEKIKAAVSNQILNKARKDIESGGSLTPEQATRNALQNYTNIEGQPMGADFGSLIGNQIFKDIYGATSKIPFTGGRAQLTKLDKQLHDKKEALAKIEHRKEGERLNSDQKRYEGDLRTAITNLEHARQLETTELPRIRENLNQHREEQQALNNHVEQAPQILNSFARPEARHANYLKQQASEAFENVRNESNALYEPVNDYEFQTENINKVESFPRYLNSLRNFHDEAADLQAIFGHSNDLGAGVNRELRSALNFITSDENPTLGAILNHTKALGRMAEYAREAGKRHEASTLMEMRRSLKEDAKTLLENEGAEDVVNALEEADSHYIENVLPWYANKEVRKTATDRNFMPDPQKFARAIHGENAGVILQSLSPEARRAAIFELLTGKAQTPNRATTLSPKEIGDRYRTQLDPRVKEALADIDPQLNDYFEGLSNSVNSLNDTTRNIGRLESQESHLQNHIESLTSRSQKSRSINEERLSNTERKKEASNAILQEKMNERFGKPKPKTKSIWAALKNISPLNAAGLGTFIYAMGHINPTKLAEMFGGSILPARKMNKLLTELESEGKNAGMPKLLSHFVEGTKVSPNLKQQGALEKRLEKALRQL